MSSAILPSLSDDEIDDLLYLARINAAHDLTAGIEAIAKSQQASPADIVSATVDPESGNSLLHMASANGCMGTNQLLYLPPPFCNLADHAMYTKAVLKSLIPLPPPSSSATPVLNINLPNSSGNTPLHWAALNGHLEAVKHLVNAGANPAIKNKAGHDAVYEAETGEKEEIVAWLLSEGKGLQTGRGGSEGEGQEEEIIEGTEGQDKENGQNGDGAKDGQNEVAGMEVEEDGR
ncbi:MAG: hypothetical protein Q9208_001167 [Pyrenodesmia sp. 3 TL-2023]